MQAVSVAVVCVVVAQTGDLKKYLNIHNSAMAGISHVTYDYVVVKSDKSDPVYGTCWMRGGTVQTKSRKGGEKYQYIADDKQVLAIGWLKNTKTGQYYASAERVPRGKMTSPDPPWQATLNYFFDKQPSNADCGLAEVLTQGYEQQCTVDGDAVKIRHSELDLVITLGVRHNCLVSSTRSAFVQGKDRQLVERQIDEYVQVAPGVYHPAKYHCTLYTNDAIKSHQEVVFSNIKIDQSSPPAPHYYNDTKMLDLIDSVEYVTDASGSRKDLKDFVPIVARPVTPSAPTAAEPSRSLWWLAPAGLLPCIAAAWIVRRRRRE